MRFVRVGNLVSRVLNVWIIQIEHIIIDKVAEDAFFVDCRQFTKVAQFDIVLLRVDAIRQEWRMKELVE